MSLSSFKDKDIKAPVGNLKVWVIRMIFVTTSTFFDYHFVEIVTASTNNLEKRGIKAPILTGTLNKFAPVNLKPLYHP